MRATKAITGTAAVVIALGAQLSLRAADTGARIEDSAKKSYTYRTYLQDDHIKIESKDGMVTLLLVAVKKA